jgi:hypothetical protein
MPRDLLGSSRSRIEPLAQRADPIRIMARLIRLGFFR